jgi:hypothetical protein
MGDRSGGVALRAQPARGGTVESGQSLVGYEAGPGRTEADNGYPRQRRLGQWMVPGLTNEKPPAL